METLDLLYTACLQGASDVHLTAGAPPMFRIDGRLTRVSEHVLTERDTEQVLRTILTDSQFMLLEQSGDLDTAYELAGVSRFRVNAYRERGHYGIAIRIIPTAVPRFEDLGLPTILRDFARRQNGLVLVTGSTGDGKSTTLAALIDVINRTESRHVVTLEDPIEYLHTHRQSIINQREVGHDTISFAQGLRAALRQDPDVILIGELRDLETMQIAITAAETGHLVFATLHTNTAAQTIDRIIDVFPEVQQHKIRQQLASVLVGICCQKLLPHPSGRGRVVACEILLNTPAVGNLIRMEKIHQLQTVMQTGRAEGMQTMEMHVKELMISGQIRNEDYHRLYSPAAFR
ncbi:type IV pilus twitching motility protein PilT [Alicyclobacillus ferrooxydans]|uniref:Twitching motility protein PilT n=1 Tax=Alicyclobacillus ferrooxydans TaxID=471514 RepID=A0A0P9GTS9_9BACL|nr:type IV pilus twitching motility protein PilT [Alicyclobacillus ferrooxydans]KPV44611.1 twitching motility protein PilT [Alicyclobacillus ferrooxydans]